MPEALEKKVYEVKLCSIKNSYVLALLTEQEFLLVNEIPDMPDFYTTGNLGYLAPEKIKRYFSSTLGKELQRAPELKVKIDFEEDWEKVLMGRAGEYSYIHRFTAQKGKPEIDLILHGPITKQDVLDKKIDSRHVKHDYSGRIIPITKEIIETEIRRELSMVNNPSFMHRGNFRKAEKLAKVAGIDFSHEIEQASQNASKKYYEKYSAPKYLNKVLKDLEESLELYHPYIAINDEEQYAEDYWSERFSDFFEHALNIIFPSEEYRKRAVVILEILAHRYAESAISAEQRLKEHVEKRKDEIEGVRGHRLQIIDLKNKIIQKANHPR